MKYLLISGRKPFKTDDLSKIEAMLREEPRMKIVQIEFNLPIPIGAIVRRTGDTEEVLLYSGESMRTLTRHTEANKNGDLSVSCNPNGAEVDVTTINVSFRDIDDTLTDRGTVWVVPGEPAMAMLELKPQQFGESNESIADIVIAAEAAVQSHVLGHFTH